MITEVIKTELNGIVFSLEFRFFKGNKFMQGHGRVYTDITQCLAYKEEEIIGLGTVVRCQCDKNDLQYARVHSAKKAIAQTILGRTGFSDIREKFWSQILNLK